MRDFLIDTLDFLRAVGIVFCLCVVALVFCVLFVRVAMWILGMDID